MPFWDTAFNSFGYTPEGMVALIGCVMLNLGRTFHTIFCSSCTVHIYGQFTRFPQPHQHLFFNCSHLNGCEVIFHCDFDLHFPNKWCCIFSYAVCPILYLPEKCLFTFAQLKKWFLLFFVVDLWGYLHILDMNPLSDTWFTKYVFRFP